MFLILTFVLSKYFVLYHLWSMLYFHTLKSNHEWKSNCHHYVKVDARVVYDIVLSTSLCWKVKCYWLGKLAFILIHTVYLYVLLFFFWTTMIEGWLVRRWGVQGYCLVRNSTPKFWCNSFSMNVDRLLKRCCILNFIKNLNFKKDSYITL